jgi:hypothetical protein
VNLLLWDVEGRTADQEIPASYLRGAHAVLLVAVDGRRETFDQLFDLREHARAAARRRSIHRRAQQGDSRTVAAAAADTAKLITDGFTR